MLFNAAEVRRCVKILERKNHAANRCAFALRGNGKYLSVQLQGLFERRVEYIYDLF